MCTLVHMSVDHLAGDPRTHHERMLAGDLYIADDPTIVETQKAAARTAARFAAACAEDPEAGQAVLAELFGSVVTKDVPANVVAVGSPARVIREII